LRENSNYTTVSETLEIFRPWEPGADVVKYAKYILALNRGAKIVNDLIFIKPYGFVPSAANYDTLLPIIAQNGFIESVKSAPNIFLDERLMYTFFDSFHTTTAYLFNEYANFAAAHQTMAFLFISHKFILIFGIKQTVIFFLHSSSKQELVNFFIKGAHIIKKRVATYRYTQISVKFVLDHKKNLWAGG